MLTAFPPDFDPDSLKRTPVLSRRSVLGFLAVSPVLAALPAVAVPDQFVLHQGWVLLASDLERLGLK